MEDDLSLWLLRPEGRHTLPHHSNPVDRISGSTRLPPFCGGMGSCHSSRTVQEIFCGFLWNSNGRTKKADENKETRRKRRGIRPKRLNFSTFYLKGNEFQNVKIMHTNVKNVHLQMQPVF